MIFLVLKTSYLQENVSQTRCVSFKNIVMNEERKKLNLIGGFFSNKLFTSEAQVFVKKKNIFSKKVRYRKRNTSELLREIL